VASRDGIELKQHESRLNWDGSAKIMKQDMVIEMLKSCKEKGAGVNHYYSR
jgi:hypothetical protein